MASEELGVELVETAKMDRLATDSIGFGGSGGRRTPSIVDELMEATLDTEESQSVSVKLKRSGQPEMSKGSGLGRVTVSDVSGTHDKNGGPKSHMSAILTAYFSVFMDTLGISIISPILPYYAEKFNANGFELGAIFSGFSFTMMISMYIMGVASDRYGRRPAILYSLFGTGLTYVIQGMAWNYWSLLGFRMLSGAFGFSQSVSAALVTDVVPTAEQPKYLAFIGASIAAAYIVGPGIGSGLSEFGMRVPFFVSGALGFLGFFYAYFHLEETHPRILEAMAKKDDDTLAEAWDLEADEDFEDENLDKFEEDTEAKDVAVGNGQQNLDNSVPFEVKFIGFFAFAFQFCMSANESMMGLFFFKKYDFKAYELGFATLIFALVFTATAVMGFPKLTKRFGPFQTICIGLALETVGFGLMPIGHNIWVTLAVIIVILGLGHGLLMPCANTTAALFTNVTNRGKVMAFLSTNARIGGTIGPLIHGALFGESIAYPFFLCSAVSVLCLMSVIVFMLTFPESTSRGKCTELKKVYEWGVEETRWDLFVPDKPTTDDKNKLGHFLADLLTARNYKWVSHYPKLQRMLKMTFPTLRTSFEEQVKQMAWIQSQMHAFGDGYDEVAGAGMSLGRQQTVSLLQW